MSPARVAAGRSTIRHRLLWLLAALWLIALVLPGRAAALSAVKLKWDTDGFVTSMVTWRDRLFLGDVYYMGRPTGDGTALGVRSGAPLARFAPAAPNGPVLAVVADGRGGYYIGGQFTAVGGLPRAGLAHLMANGGVDPSWQPTVGGGLMPRVAALAVSGSTIYVGGSFTRLDGQRRLNLAAVTAGRGALTNWRPDPNHGVDALTVAGDTLYVGGGFSRLDHLPLTEVAAVSLSTGHAVPSFSASFGGATVPGLPFPVQSEVDSLAVAGGVVYVGGTFSAVDGEPRTGVAALSVLTGRLTSFDPMIVGVPEGRLDVVDVTGLGVAGATVYLAGLFVSIDGQESKGLGGVDAATGQSITWQPSPPAYASALIVSGATVYAAGAQNSANFGYVLAVSTANAQATAWTARANGPIFALAQSGSTVYGGGELTSVGGHARDGLAEIDLSTGRLLPFNPRIDGPVSALARRGSTIYAGGAFHHVDGRQRNGGAAFAAGSGRLAAWDPDVEGPFGSGEVVALAISGHTVYLGGLFTGVGGRRRINLAAVDTGRGAPESWSPTVDKSIDEASTTVSALAIGRGVVYAGGGFVRIDHESRNGLAAISMRTGRPTRWNPHPGAGGVTAIAVTGRNVFFAGGFSSVGGRQQPGGLAAADIESGGLLPWQPNPDGVVSVLVSAGSTVFVGGDFTMIDGKREPDLAAVDAATGRLIPWAAHAAGFVSALALTKAGVYLSYFS